MILQKDNKENSKDGVRKQRESFKENGKKNTHSESEIYI